MNYDLVQKTDIHGYIHLPSGVSLSLMQHNSSSHTWSYASPWGDDYELVTALDMASAAEAVVQSLVKYHEAQIESGLAFLRAVAPENLEAVLKEISTNENPDL